MTNTLGHDGSKEAMRASQGVIAVIVNPMHAHFGETATFTELFMQPGANTSVEYADGETGILVGGIYDKNGTQTIRIFEDGATAEIERFQMEIEDGAATLLSLLVAMEDEDNSDVLRNAAAEAYQTLIDGVAKGCVTTWND